MPSLARPGLFPLRLMLAVLLGVGVMACERDREAALRSDLSQWFFLGETLYFNSRPRCTGAITTLTVGRPRPALAIQTTIESAQAALIADRVAAIQVEGASPADLSERMRMTGTGTFGRQTLAAAALAGDCFADAEISGQLYEALTRPGAILAYHSSNAALMVVDPARNRLFYVAGDAW